MVRARLGIALLLLGCVAPVAAQGTCGDIMPTQSSDAAPRRPITSLDLVRLRDIGHPDPLADEVSPLALSPDRRSLAFVISRGDPSDNVICRALVILPLDGHAPPGIIDRGGELPIVSNVLRGTGIPTGFPDIVTPGWSPDGHWLAYLKRDAGVTQLWRVRTDGSRADPVTHSPVDVETWSWSEDGQAITYRSSPSLLAAQGAIDAEGRSGYHYDARVSPDMSWRPQVEAAAITSESFTVALNSRAVRVSSPQERARLSTKASADLPSEPTAISLNGRRAWAKPSGPSPLSPNRLWIDGDDGRPRACAAEACEDGIQHLWWSPDGRSIWFVRREGWNKERTALYRWSPGARRASVIVQTLDALSGCIPDESTLICIRENSTKPRHIVAIDMASGRSTTLFDPNPEFRTLSLGPVQRLRWTNDLGLPAWGDLVLPPDKKPGIRLPLVVVQYRSRGFLRGGTGGEYPVFPLAAAGFAVLSIERPPHIATLHPEVRSFDDVNAIGRKDWAERKSLLSSLLVGLDLASRSAPIDRARVGITGLSDGASTAVAALIGTDRFAAAAISSCCIDPDNSMTYGGIAWADWNHRVMGFPLATQHDSGFWRSQSLALNAARLRTPLLLQLADDEALLSLETFTALREHRQPVDLYVFPNEYHSKWQPAHLLAVYQRDIDWFNFWLRSIVDPNPGKAAQYRRWEQLRDARPTSPGP